MPPADDPCPEYRFLVEWGGRPVAGFAEASPLPQELARDRTVPAGYPPPALGPEGQRTPYFISLDRGTAWDLAFEQWLSMVRSFGPATGKGSLLVEYKRPVTIRVCTEDGEAECAYHLTRCWVTEYKATPDPDPGSRTMVIGHLRLGFETWHRDPPEEARS